MKIQENEKGNTRLVLELSAEELQKLKELFELGELKEVAGIPIEEIQFNLLPLNQKPVKLGRWVKNVFESSWIPAIQAIGSAQDNSKESVIADISDYQISLPPASFQWNEMSIVIPPILDESQAEVHIELISNNESNFASLKSDQKLDSEKEREIDDATCNNNQKIDIYNNNWSSVQGRGVVIGIVDDGLESNHPDLIQKYNPDLSHNYCDHGVAADVYNKDSSQLWTAGVAAGTDLEILLLSGDVNELDNSPTELFQEQWSLKTLISSSKINENIEIISDTDTTNTFEINKDKDTEFLITRAGSLSENCTVCYSATSSSSPSISPYIELERNTIGNIYVFACGNEGNNVNYNYSANSRYVIPVAAIDNNMVYSEEFIDLKLSQALNQFSRAKIIDLGEQSVALIVALNPEENRIGIKLSVFPIEDDLYLPEGLQLMVLDREGKLIDNLKLIAGSTQNYLTLPASSDSLFYESGKQFMVKVAWGDNSMTEVFEI
jgi:hypothetical protein